MSLSYDDIHGPGRSNFSPPSYPHRLPTVSASQALQDLNGSPTRCVSSSLPLLDYALQNVEPGSGSAVDEGWCGGVSRGKVTEIYGPPGVGKTTLGLQMAIKVLRAGEGVVWVDTAHQLSGHRLSQLLSSPSPTSTTTANIPLPTQLSNLTHFQTPALSHLLALFSLLTPTHPPPNTTLLIIDSIPILFALAYPRTINSSSTTNSNNNNGPSHPNSRAQKKPSGPNPNVRKLAIQTHLLSTLQKLAATRNIAIVLLSPVVTKMRMGIGAALVPGINTTAWEQGLSCRVALFRDWGFGCTKTEDEHEGKGKGLEREVKGGARFASVLKAEGVVVPEGRVRVIGFAIEERGCVPLTLPSYAPPPSPPPPPPPPFPRFDGNRNANELPLNLPPAQQQQNLPIHSSPLKPQPQHPPPLIPQKRTHEETSFEIPDSEGEDDEDYGWDEEDEDALPPPPPQTQGTEDAFGPGVGGGFGGEGGGEGFERDEELDELGEVGVYDGEGDRLDEGGEGVVVEDGELGDSGIDGEQEEGDSRRREVVDDSEDELAL